MNQEITLSPSFKNITNTSKLGQDQFETNMDTEDEQNNFKISNEIFEAIKVKNKRMI